MLTLSEGKQALLLPKCYILRNPQVLLCLGKTPKNNKNVSNKYHVPNFPNSTLNFPSSGELVPRKVNRSFERPIRFHKFG